MSTDGLTELRERDARINAWLENVEPGTIVTVRLNSTDTLTGKVYEAPDASGRTALYVYTTLLRHGNGYPGGSFEPVTVQSFGDHPHVDAVRKYLEDGGITPETLRYAATHEALCRHWIFDLLTNLAIVLEES